MELRLTLKLSDDFAQLAVARRVSRDVLSSMCIGPDDVDDIEILVGELATNAARHGHAHWYNVELALRNDIVAVTVTDHGAGFSPELVSHPGTVRMDDDSDGERFGGWGLPLVARLADTIEFTTNVPHGTRVRVEKRCAFSHALPGPNWCSVRAEPAAEKEQNVP
jgi:anti-sigma regulatory factor (Ser/Thr protein kinase)